MTPIADRPALDGCTVAGTTAMSGGAAAGDMLEAGHRATPVARDVAPLSGTVGDLLEPIPLVNWSIQFLLVHPKSVEGPLAELLNLPPFVVPSVGFDGSVSAMQSWFFRQTGSRLRIQPEIRTVVLSETNDQIAAHGEHVRDRIELLLRERGFDHPFTLYAAWYFGVSNHACGGGAWPHGVAPPPNEQTPGHLAALYLWAAFGNVVCAADAFSPDGETPAIQEFKMLHEILHTMGIVSPGGPASSEAWARRR